MMRRRQFLRRTGGGITALGVAAMVRAGEEELTEAAALAMRGGDPIGDPRRDDDQLFFRISLAQWSLHRSFWSGDLDNLEFAGKARELGFSAIEYVNQFFADKAEDSAYLEQMNQRAEDAGVDQLLIMVDGEGSLAHADETERLQAVENHRKWVSAAKHLGCHTIRVNAQGKGESEDVASRAIDSLGRLAEYAAEEAINVVVENHGGYSSSGAWLASVIERVDKPNCGTLPDFGNFRMALFPPRSYDRYQGVAELMPWAKGVSAKSYDFNADGQESSLDFARLLGIVKEAGYQGHIGVEYEGSRLSEEAGILATANLLRTAGAN
jgi:sugar phosphate isomerase/epimerase